MRVHRTVGATAVAVLVLGGLSGPALAIDNGSQVTTGAAVTAGNRDATLGGNVSFAAVSASHSASSPADETTSVTIDDLSGSHAGWTVSIVASDLTHTNTVAKILASNISVDSFGSLTPTDSNVVPGSTGSVGSSRTLVSADATFGVGLYSQAFDLGLNVPANSLAGSYSGTLTVTIAPAS